VSRRMLAGGTIAAGATAVAATMGRRVLGPHRLPLDGGYAPAGNSLGWSGRGAITCFWHVPTEAPLVALTFDDGPMPDWTPRVLDTLAKLDVQASFFLVGRHLRDHAKVVAGGRYDGHEIGNHTWSHADLAQLDAEGVLKELQAAHDEIALCLGREPRLMRPPWGHVGGSTLIAADHFGYDIALWSQPMPEKQYAGDPQGFVQRVVADARPGSILLAHDVGAKSRLLMVDNLAAIVQGLRAKGLKPVTLSELLAAAQTAPASGS
jgi:peptidoglycan-N-acetylglucosamine deacetylase